MDTEIINEIDLDVIMLTTKTVEFLLSTNPDALTLYIFYIKNSKIQETNSIWNTDTFGMTGLGWGRDRYTRAKNTLLDNKFITITEGKSEDGKFAKKYVRIKYLFKEITKDTILQHTSTVVSNPVVAKTTRGETPTNALSNKSNALSNKKEIHTPDGVQVVKITKKEEKRLASLRRKEERERLKREIELNYTFEGEMQNLFNTGYKPNQIVWLYFKKKRYNFENIYQWRENVAQCLPAGRKLMGYDSDQISKTMDACEEKWQDNWTLYAIPKQIANITNKR